MALNLKHQTIAQFTTRLRKRFHESSQMERGRIATWIYNRYVSGDFTINQLRNAFGLNTTEEWVTFRDRLLALKDHYLVIKAEEAE